MHGIQHDVLDHKRRRLTRGGRPRVLDLFAGCGGLALGLHRAGFEIMAGVEAAARAAGSFARNFHPGSPSHARPRDITRLTPAELCEELGLGPVERAVDVVVGGPPCQAFARIGRAKLRAIRDDPEAFLHDARAGLHERWLAWVRELAPIAVLVENVPDALNAGGRNVAEEIAGELDALGFVPRYTLLNAVHYGVPQMRERMFLIAIHRRLGVTPTFPPPTHAFSLPSGYDGSRRVALRFLPRDDLFATGFWTPAPTCNGSALPAVTAGEVIGGRPPVTPLRRSTLRRGLRRLDRARRGCPPCCHLARAQRSLERPRSAAAR